jgi:hypothetical protein
MHTVKNLAILIFSVSAAPDTSASAISFSAGGPTGINIIANHSMGSSESRDVLLASAHTMGMLMLCGVLEMGKGVRGRYRRTMAR